MTSVNKSRRGFLGLLALAPVAAVAAPTIASAPRYGRATYLGGIVNAKPLLPLQGATSMLGNLNPSVIGEGVCTTGYLVDSVIATDQIASAFVSADVMNTDLMSTDLQQDPIALAFSRLHETSVDLRTALDGVDSLSCVEQGPAIGTLKSLA